MFVLHCTWPSYFFLCSFEEVPLWVSLRKMAPELGLLCSCHDSIHYSVPSQCPVKCEKVNVALSACCRQLSVGLCACACVCAHAQVPKCLRTEDGQCSLTFIKSLLGLCWDDHMVFIPFLTDMIYTRRLPALRSRHELACSRCRFRCRPLP